MSLEREVIRSYIVKAKNGTWKITHPSYPKNKRHCVNILIAIKKLRAWIDSEPGMEKELKEQWVKKVKKELSPVEQAQKDREKEDKILTDRTKIKSKESLPKSAWDQFKLYGRAVQDKSRNGTMGRG